MKKDPLLVANLQCYIQLELLQIDIILKEVILILAEEK